MRKKKIIKNILVALLSLLFILSPFRLDNFHFGNFKAQGMDHIEISQDTVWEAGEHIINNWIEITNGATLTIEKGAIIKFAKDGEYIPILSVENGRIAAEGTKDEKIIFTALSDSDEYGINFYNSDSSNKASFFRYVIFEKGGYVPQLVHNNLINTAYASGGMSALNFSSGKVHIENSEFKDNPYGAVSAGSYESSDYFEIVNSNFENNSGQAADLNAYCLQEDEETGECEKYNILLKNNWYGDASGPYRENIGDEEENGEGEVIAGYFDYGGYKKNDLIADPVIIIPGIMGSTKILGKWKLDPILHIYDNLLSSFEKNNYEENKNLFEFPYEWRNNNEDTADLLKQKIQDVINETKVSKVDLLAHSMGGLVARAYIEDLDNQNNIDQLVTIGTPHGGAPESYLSWEAGELGANLKDKIIKNLFKVEAFHSGYINLKEYIQDKVKSVGQLLPDYDYLEENGSIREYPNNYPKNDFLDSLNDKDNIDNLKKVSFYNIIGKTSGEKTIAKFRVVDSMKDGLWEHGMPENFYDNSTDQGIEYGEGDGAVPEKSSDIDYADKTEEIDSRHNDLPTNAQCYAIKELTGKDSCDFVSTFKRIKSILTFGVFSPVDIQVIDKNGNWAGKNIQGLEPDKEIGGAYYSGYDTGNEFLTIPNPIDGEYRIITEGTDNGDYKIETAKISEDENTGQASESAVEITGTAIKNESEELKIEVNGNEVKIGKEEPEESITIDSIIKYVQENITDRQTKLKLGLELRKIKLEMKLLEKFQSGRLPQKAKDKIIANLKKQINREIDRLIKQIQKDKKFQKTISAEARAELIEKLEKIKI